MPLLRLHLFVSTNEFQVMSYKYCVIRFILVKTEQQMLFAFENYVLYFGFHHSEPLFQTGTSN